MNPGWISVVPPLAAIVLAIWTRKIYLSLLTGIYFGWLILADWNPLLAAADTVAGIVNVFQSAGNTEVVIFCAIIGSLIGLIQRSGGVNGFVNLLVGGGAVKTRRGAQLAGWITGVIVFIETTISSLVIGAVSRPIFDKMKISRAKLAYICDSTSAPACSLILMNAWGAYLLQLFSRQGVDNPVEVLLGLLLYNFYPIAAILLVLVLIITGKDFGPMTTVERIVVSSEEPGNSGVLRADENHVEKKTRARASNMILPVAVLVVSMPVYMLVTGKGDITQGVGSTSVLWAVITAVFAAGLLYMINRSLTLEAINTTILKGISELMPLAILMVLAFAIGDVTTELKTGSYIAGLTHDALPKALAPAILFLVSAAISFATGTSWGTFAIMIPIAVSLAGALDSSLSLLAAGVVGGGVFGDHCSPISDTTVVASMAASCDHIEHVRTQLPYAVVAAVIALALFVFAGLITSIN
jgi:Na+/H+ antiporter NhaC